jgi:hypothetical protein
MPISAWVSYLVIADVALTRETTRTRMLGFSIFFRFLNAIRSEDGLCACAGLPPVVEIGHRTVIWDASADA